VAGREHCKRHTRPARATTQGGIIDKDMARFPCRPVAIICSKDGPNSDPLRVRRGWEQATRLREMRGHAVTAALETTAPPRLKVRYESEIRAQLKESLGLSNIMEVPNLTKIVVNIGVGRATQQQSLLEGRSPRPFDHHRAAPGSGRSRGSPVAGFKLREGNAIGTMVTLRGARMWSSSTVSCRSRSRESVTFAVFRRGRSMVTAITPSGDRAADLPEIEYDKIDATRGMDIRS